MNPQLSPIEQNHPPSARVTEFCESSRAVITRSILTQGALFDSIRALAASALDGGDQTEALQNIDLVARVAMEAANRLANTVGTIPTTTSL